MSSRPVPVKRVSDRADDDSGYVVDTVRDLIRSIVECIASNLPDPADPTRELVLDTEVDGVRYLLIRPICQTPRVQNVLSPRELEVARMVAKGYPNKVIAGVLDISSWTVCTHLRRIFAKLGVTSRAAMVAKVIEEGMSIGSSPPWESRQPRDFPR
jgi:DNA-binding NarL/FixJ family response regulator